MRTLPETRAYPLLLELDSLIPRHAECRDKIIPLQRLGTCTDMREDMSCCFVMEPNPANTEVTRAFLRKALDAQAETMATVFQEEFTEIAAAASAATKAAQEAKIVADEARLATAGLQESVQKLKKAQDALEAQLAMAQAKIEDLETRAAHQPSPVCDAQEQEAEREAGAQAPAPETVMAHAASSGLQMQDVRKAAAHAMSSGPRGGGAPPASPCSPARAHLSPSWPFYLDAGSMRVLQAASVRHYAAMESWIAELSDEQCEESWIAKLSDEQCEASAAIHQESG